MANQEHLDRLNQGIGQWNTWRREHPEVRPDLSKAILNKTNLSYADFSRSNLSYTDFSYTDLIGVNLKEAYLGGAHLSDANLTGANMERVNLKEAYLGGTNLSLANLIGAYLYGAYLYRANFSDANLSGVNLETANLQRANLKEALLRKAHLERTNFNGTNLSQVTLSSTIFSWVDLRATKGLVQIKHEGPSIVHLGTIQLPQDGSAQHFLRGVGISDEWIEFYLAQRISPIQYHSCFISYTHRDEQLAQRLHSDLQGAGVRCWFAPHDLKIGERYRSRINEAIHLQEKLLLILSEAAIESDWVETEVEAALEKERRQKRDILFPIRLDDSFLQTEEAWTAHIRQTRHIGDFTCWKEHDSYQKAFARLLRDLKTL